MAKGSNKLSKLKSVLKIMQSFKIGRVNESLIMATNHSSSNDDKDDDVNVNYNEDLHTVYVGKSLRRYVVNSDVIHHPLFRELVDRSGQDSDHSITVGCEVVLFDHMLWMLENADPQPESLDELVDFYVC